MKQDKQPRRAMPTRQTQPAQLTQYQLRECIQAIETNGECTIGALARSLRLNREGAGVDELIEHLVAENPDRDPAVIDFGVRLTLWLL